MSIFYHMVIMIIIILICIDLKVVHNISRILITIQYGTLSLIIVPKKITMTSLLLLVVQDHGCVYVFLLQYGWI